MFHTKAFVDCFCEKIRHKVQDEKERRLSYYGIAQLYSQVEEHELALKYVSEYLIVQRNSAPAHELLGQSYEALGQKESALEAYKRSFQLNKKQDHLILKICELFIDKKIDADFSQIPYWIKKAVSKYPDHPVVLELKQEISNNELDNTKVEEIKSKISLNPSDVNLQIRLIKYYISKHRIEDAFKHAIEVESTDTYHQSFTWYQCFYDLLTRIKVYKYTDSSFWVFLVTASERYVALTLAEYGDKVKTISEVIQVLFNFDQDLYEAQSKIDKSCDRMLVRDQMFDHMHGQLYYHLACLWLRLVKTEVTTWQETVRVFCPLLHTAFNLTIVNPKASWRYAKDNQILQWHKEGSYRYSQAGHMLTEYIKPDYDYRLTSIIIESTNNSWYENTYCKIFADRYSEKLIKTSYFMNNIKEKLSYDPLVTKLEGFDKSAQLIYPDSLHAEIIEQSTSHYQFVKPSDQYIPRELVMRSDPDYKKFIESLLEKNFTVNPNSINDKDFVYATVENGHLPILLQLLELGINVNMVNPETGLNLLAIAYLNKHHKIVKILLKHNADVNMKIHSKNEMSTNQLRTYSNMHVFNRLMALFCSEDNLNEVTCLHMAVMNSDAKMTRRLLKFGAKIEDDPNFFKITCIAIRQNCKEIVGIFLDHGLDVTNIGPQGEALFDLCIRSDIVPDSTYNIVELLLEKGGATQIQTPNNSFLFKAMKEEHHKIAQLFLDHHANVEYVSENADTLLHVAIEQDMNPEFIKTLLNLNLAVDAVNCLERTPLLLACSLEYINQLANVEALLHHNPNINCTDDEMWTPLHSAVDNNNLELITVLLEKGADTNITDALDRTPLHLACYEKNDETLQIIQLLLQYNAKIETVDEDGWTPLIGAARFGNDVAVECLLKNGANVNHTDSDNLTPLFNAVQNSHYNVVSMLLDHKINVFCTDKLGNSEIHLIANSNQYSVIQRLVHTKINFNSVNKEGNTPLHIAVKKNFVDMTKSLIKYGSDINVLDKDNETALQKAANVIAFPVDVSNSIERIQCWKKQKRIINILKKQVVKLKTAELEVHQQNLNIVYHFEYDITNYFEYLNENDSDDEESDEEDDAVWNIPELEVDCEQEIEAMKMESISSTGMTDNITFLDLLKTSVHYLSRYVRNEKIQKTLKRKIYDDKFPLYIDIIRSRFRDAKFRYKLVKSAIKYFRINIYQNLPDNCIDLLLSYLSNEELKMIIGDNMPLNA